MDLVLVDTRSGKRRTVAMGKAPIVIGSGVDCDVVVPAPEIAERACQAVASSEGIVLEAITGGFLLNERPAKAAILHPGDVVKLGPFHLVAAGTSAPPPAPPPPPPPAAPVAPRRSPADEAAARAAREAQLAARRPPKKGNPAAVGIALLLIAAGGAFVWWKFGSKWSKTGTTGGGNASPTAPNDPSNPGGDPSNPSDPDAGRNGTAYDREHGGRPLVVGGTEANKPSSTKDVSDTLARVNTLVVAGEFARARWLLWQLRPTSEEDRARIDTRRKEVEAEGNKAGEEQLKLADRLLHERGNPVAALSACEEETVERFRGLRCWYTLLEKADECEAVIDERMKDAPGSMRPRQKRKHARPVPPDIENLAPPPVDDPTAKIDTDLLPTLGGKPPERETKPKDPSMPPAAIEKDAGPPPPTPEQLAAIAAVSATLKELAAAKPSAMDAIGKKLGEAVHAAKEGAVAPLLEHCEPLAAALAHAPESAQLAELRKKLQALAEARVAALAFVQDEKRYLAHDPKQSEVEKAQKEAERLIGDVREIWGNEEGGAPAPQFALSDEYVKLAKQVTMIDALLAELGKKLPDHPELLGTRLLPLWAPKVSVRNYALTIEERRRIDANRECMARSQQLKDVKPDDLKVLFSTNKYREMLGGVHLEFDPKLYEDAKTYAQLMAEQTKGSKDSDPQPESSPLAKGSKPKPGENYLRGRFSAGQALQTWCKIPVAHRNLLAPEHKSMAAASAGTFWTQVFAVAVPGAAPPKGR